MDEIKEKERLSRLEVLPQNYEYKLSFLGLQFTGIWPYYSNFRRLTSFFLFLVMMFVTMTPLFTKLVKVWGEDIRTVVENTVAISYTILLFLKYVTAFHNRTKFKKLFLEIDEDWEMFPNKDEQKILSTMYDEGKFYVKLCTIYSLTVLIIFSLIPFTPKVLNILFPLSNGTYPLIIPAQMDYILFNQSDYHYYSCFHISFVLISSSPIFISLETLYLHAVKHTCGLFAITCQRIEKIDDLLNEHDNDFQLQDAITKQLASAIVCYIKSINRITLLENIFCSSFLVTILIYMIEIPLTGIYIINALDYLDLLIRAIIYMMGILIHTSFINIVGQEIINSSEKIFNSACNSHWYLIPVKTKFFILMIMMKAKKPCALSAGGLFFLSVENLANFIKTTWSWFSIFLSVIEINK